MVAGVPHPGHRRQGRDPGDLGVRVVDVRVEVGASQHHQHPVLGLVHEQHLDVGDGDALVQLADHLHRFQVGNAAGPAVGDVPLGVDGGEVAAGGHVARVEVHVEAGGGQGAAAEVVVEGVVAEQRQVGGPGAGCDARPDRVEQAGAARRSQGVEVGRVRLFELRAPIGGGEAGEAVEDDQQDLRGGGLYEGGQVERHDASSVRLPPGWSCRVRWQRAPSGSRATGRCGSRGPRAAAAGAGEGRARRGRCDRGRRPATRPGRASPGW